MPWVTAQLGVVLAAGGRIAEASCSDRKAKGRLGAGEVRGAPLATAGSGGPPKPIGQFLDKAAAVVSVCLCDMQSTRLTDRVRQSYCEVTASCLVALAPAPVRRAEAEAVTIPGV
jgi:hypothetical protein